MTGRTESPLAAAPAAPPPSDYRLAVPDGWERIVLDSPERWAHRIDKLVKRGLRRTQATPQLEAALAERMRAQAEAAQANGGVEMYVVNQILGQVPVSAGLVVTVLRPSPGTEAGDLGDIARALALGADAAADDVTLVDLPAGPAVRHRYLRRPAADDPDGNKLAVAHLDVYLAVPHSDLRLLLSFSTPAAPPLEPLVEALVGLFDSVARTLQWMA
ncbi:hypothetical protein [Streptomyces shenzhenensis]|uniref:hypothetical protein n=1 Tax=Streptomyces shenzhenensis TaxID=943815 RepID=UPI0015F06D45|nr:hypothetical protein [Streptomyces shenzhenensis]